MDRCMMQVCHCELYAIDTFDLNCLLKIIVLVPGSFSTLTFAKGKLSRSQYRIITIWMEENCGGNINSC